ncbi:hypothetical protein N1I86_05995 [Bacillus sp. FSL W8-0116]|uniref:hypothetical protein n=1 Tax=Bacillus sp. FSL W8-0116 TaxID=2978206 RepID=UPI0030F67205
MQPESASFNLKSHKKMSFYAEKYWLKNILTAIHFFHRKEGIMTNHVEFKE